MSSASRCGGDVEVQRLDFEEFVDPVMRAFAAEPRLLDAAEGRHGGGDYAGVDADHSGLERFTDAKRTVHIPGEDVGGESIGRVVGATDRFGFTGEAEQRGDR